MTLSKPAVHSDSKAWALRQFGWAQDTSCCLHGTLLVTVRGCLQIRAPIQKRYMYYSLNSSKGGYKGDYIGNYYRGY